MDRVVVESAEEIKDSQESAEGYIKVSVSEALGNSWLLPKMKSFVFRHSRIQLDFQLTDRIVDLRQREADVAIRIGELSDSDLFQAHLGTFRWKAYVSDGYRHMRGEISRRDYAHVCVVPPESSTGWANQGGKWLRGAVKRAGLASHQSVVVNSLTGIREAILNTLGIGALPSFLGDSHRLLLEEPTLGEGPELDVYFVCPAELRSVERISHCIPSSANNSILSSIHRKQRGSPALPAPSVAIVQAPKPSGFAPVATAGIPSIPAVSARIVVEFGRKPAVQPVASPLRTRIGIQPKSSYASPAYRVSPSHTCQIFP